MAWGLECVKRIRAIDKGINGSNIASRSLTWLAWITEWNACRVNIKRALGVHSKASKTFRCLESRILWPEIMRMRGRDRETRVARRRYIHLGAKWWALYSCMGWHLVTVMSQRIVDNASLEQNYRLSLACQSHQIHSNTSLNPILGPMWVYHTPLKWPRRLAKDSSEKTHSSRHKTYHTLAISMALSWVQHKPQVSNESCAKTCLKRTKIAVTPENYRISYLEWEPSGRAVWPSAPMPSTPFST